MKPKLSASGRETLSCLYQSERRLLIRIAKCGTQTVDEDDCDDVPSLMDYGLIDAEHNLTPAGAEIANHLTYDEADEW